MTEQSKHGAPPPLPRDWLPNGRPPEDAPAWDAATRRIMVAAGPELHRLRSNHSAAPTSWSVMALWWKPAAALAAASIALLLIWRPAFVPELPPGSIPLALVASDGDPSMFWGTLGVQADPVLAQIVIRDQATITRQDGQATGQEEGNR